MQMPVDRAIGLFGIVITVILLVVDKAGKLKGPVLYLLLAFAACMTVPLLFVIPWVRNAPPGAAVVVRRLIAVCTVAVVYLLLTDWVLTGSKTLPEVTPPASAPVDMQKAVAPSIATPPAQSSSPEEPRKATATPKRRKAPTEANKPGRSIIIGSQTTTGPNSPIINGDGHRIN